MTRPRTRAREVIKRAELSLTPMIDVVFLLLIFFMLGMEFRAMDRELGAELPHRGDTPDDHRPPLIEVWIQIGIQDRAAAQPQPRVVVDGRPLTTWRQVYSHLHELTQIPSATETYQVIVAPDDDVPHEWVMKVLDYLKKLRYANVAFKQ